MSDILGRVFFGDLDHKPDLSSLQVSIESFAQPIRSEPLSLNDLVEQLRTKYMSLVGWAAAETKARLNRLDQLISDYSVVFSDGPTIVYEDESLKTDIYEVRCKQPDKSSCSVVVVSQYFKDRQTQQWYSTLYSGPNQAERTETEWEEFNEVAGQACPVNEEDVIRMTADVIGMPL